MPRQILPDCIDDCEKTVERTSHGVDPNKEPIPTVLIQVEDFEGSFLPHYGSNQPSVNYFNSNLILYNFVSYNINDDVNHVSLYNKQG